jgi:hypothetical protein
MKTYKNLQDYPHAVINELQTELFVEPLSTTHRDRFAQQSHELSDEASEASSRALIRLVPVLYGGLFGGLADIMLLGFLAGAIVSMSFDFLMGKNSMLRALFRKNRAGGSDRFW